VLLHALLLHALLLLKLVLLLCSHLLLLLLLHGSQALCRQHSRGCWQLQPRRA
jgi:hypothetical protein